MKASRIDRSSLSHFNVQNGQGHFKLNTASLQALQMLCLSLKFRLDWLEICNLRLQLAQASVQNSETEWLQSAVLTFQSRLGKQHAVVGNNPNRLAIQLAKASDKGIAILLFELVKPRAIQEPCQDCSHIPGFSRICRDYTCRQKHIALLSAGCKGRLTEVVPRQWT